MLRKITLGTSEIVISKEPSGMGIYLSGPSDVTGDIEFEEASELLGKLIDYLIPTSEETRRLQLLEEVIPYIPTVLLPPGILEWVRENTPWIWGSRVIATEESLRYYETLEVNLKSKALREGISGVDQINCLRRADYVNQVCNEIRKHLGKLS